VWPPTVGRVTHPEKPPTTIHNLIHTNPLVYRPISGIIRAQLYMHLIFLARNGMSGAI
jgi:hypothetical protein